MTTKKILGKNTFEPIPYSSWIKNNTQQKAFKQTPHRNKLFPIKVKENLSHAISLPVFNLTLEN